MSSSTFCEVTLEQGDRRQTLRVPTDGSAPRAAFADALRTDQPARLRVVGDGAAAVRVLLGSGIAAFLPVGRTHTSAEIGDLLRDLCGSTELVLERPSSADDDDAPDHVALFCRVGVPLRAPEATERLYRALVDDLEQAHTGLARDFLGRSSAVLGGAPLRRFDPERDLHLLESVQERLARALPRIGLQPSTVLVRSVERRRWRAGDSAGARVSREILSSPDTRFRDGRITQIGVVTLDRPRLTTDLPEHRHLKASLRWLERRANQVAEGCERHELLIDEERSRWDSARAMAPSVFDQRHGNRQRQLRHIMHRSRRVAQEFRALAEAHAFLREAGPPRTRFGPTPLFLGRPTYREAYEAIRAAREMAGGELDTRELEVRLRDLDTLYEYWSFVKVVAALRTMLGAPARGDGYRLIDEVYRPDLTPGQQFSWTADGGATISVHYEPDVPPWHVSRAGPHGWKATLGPGTLRPDVLVTVLHPARPARALVIDAKNSTVMHDPTRLFEFTDYRTRIHDPRDGSQPLRWTVFVHRTADAFHASFPRFFDGAEPPQDAWLLAAMPLVPGADEPLAALLARFVAWCGAASR